MKNYFQFNELGTNYRREILGGLTTFLSMAYILVVNPVMLTLAKHRGLSGCIENGLRSSFCRNSLSSRNRFDIDGTYSQISNLLLPQVWA